MNIFFQVGNTQFVRDDEFRPYFRTLEDFNHGTGTVFASAPIEGAFTRTTFLRAKVNARINENERQNQLLVNYCATTVKYKKLFWFVESYSISGTAITYHLYLDCGTTYISHDLGATYLNNDYKVVHTLRRHDFNFFWDQETNTYPVSFYIAYPGEYNLDVSDKTIILNEDKIDTKNFITTDVKALDIYDKDYQRAIHLNYNLYTYAWYFIATEEGEGQPYLPYSTALAANPRLGPPLGQLITRNWFSGLTLVPVSYRVSEAPTRFFPVWDSSYEYWGGKVTGINEDLTDARHNFPLVNHVENLLYNDNSTLKSAIHAPFAIPFVYKGVKNYFQVQLNPMIEGGLTMTGMPTGLFKPSFVFVSDINYGQPTDSNLFLVTSQDGLGNDDFYQDPGPLLCLNRRMFEEGEEIPYQIPESPLRNFLELPKTFGQDDYIPGKPSLEPKLFLSQFLKFSIRSYKGQEHIVSNERLLTHQNLFPDISSNFLQLTGKGIVSPLSAYMIFKFNSSSYLKMGNDFNQVSFDVGLVAEHEASYTLQFLLNHASQYNASVAQSKIGIGLSATAAAAGIAAGVAAPFALGLKGAVTKSGIAGGLGGIGGIGAITRSAFGLGNLHAQMADIERQPAKVSLPRTDELYPTVNRFIEQVAGFGRTGCNLTCRQFNATIQTSLALHYTKYGYLANLLENITYQKLGYFKKDFNYGEIAQISLGMTRTNKLNKQVINEIDDLFAKGVRLWTYSQVVGGEMERYIYYNFDNPLTRPKLQTNLTPAKKR